MLKLFHKSRQAQGYITGAFENEKIKRQRCY